MGCGWWGLVASVYGHRLGFFLKNFNLHRVLLFTFLKKHSGSRPVKIQRLIASLIFISVMSKHGSFYL